MAATQVRTFEHALVYHCAPSMVGIKAADLFSWPLIDQKELDAYTAALQVRDITLRVMRRSRQRMLLLVYRRSCLERRLSCPAVRRMLEEEGYPVEGDVETLLDCLAGRLQQQEFPHEIGLFLGYPPEDVEGFRRCKGRDFKLCGRWKVYGDQDAAQRYFRRCDRCRDLLCRRLERCPLTEMFPPIHLQEQGA